MQWQKDQMLEHMAGKIVSLHLFEALDCQVHRIVTWRLERFWHLDRPKENI